MATQRSKQRNQTAQRIFEVAMLLFQERGFEATTVDEITSAAGVAKGTFFVHFPSKQAILAHLGRIQMERAAALVAHRPDFEERHFREQLQILFETFGAGVEAEPEIVRVVAFELLRSHAALHREADNIGALDQLLERLVRQAQARDQIRSDKPARVIASMLRGIYLFSVLEWLSQDQQRFMAIAEQYIQLTLEGIEV